MCFSKILLDGRAGRTGVRERGGGGGSVGQNEVGIGDQVETEKRQNINEIFKRQNEEERQPMGGNRKKATRMRPGLWSRRRGQ